MKKQFILNFFFLLICQINFAQTLVQNENKMKNFLKHPSNASFINIINLEFERLKKMKVDSIGLFFKDSESAPKYALVWGRKKNKYYGKKFLQDVENNKILEYTVDTTVIRSLNNYEIYNIVSNDSIRRPDPLTMYSHDFIFYFKFLFKGKKYLFGLYHSEISYYLQDYDFSFINKLFGDTLFY